MDKMYAALRQMRDLSDQNVPFTFSFVSCNLTRGTSDGVKVVKKGKLRRGFASDKSKKSSSLIGYVDVETGKNRWFYLPLLLSFNNQDI